MKILVYNPYTLDNNSAPVILDEALEYLDDPQNEVVFVSCSGQLRPCVTNSEQSRVRCAECRFSTRLLLRLAPHSRLQHATLSAFEERDAMARVAAHTFDYESLRDVRSLAWNGINIGLSVVSTYVSMTRNLDPDLNQWNRQFIDDSLRAEARLVEMAMAMFDVHHPDLVCLFNGRFVGLRAVLEVAQQRGIRVQVMENAFSKNFDEANKVSFFGSLPHDIDRISPVIEANWESWDRPTPREVVATEFYERRRKGEMASDQVYVGNQRPRLLPETWDESKRNFVIFNSSEDEFFSVGEAFDKYKLFDEQIDGVRYLAAKTAGDTRIQYYLRVHPNLARIPYAYHTRLASIARDFPNVSVIPATSPISTYALIDRCEKVFVFGSTAGVEATFWEKPVVLLGGALYLHLDAAYYPTSFDELDQLIVAKLSPKPKIGALKYGLFLFGDRGKPYKHVNFNYRQIAVGGKRLPIARCFEVNGSIIPYAALVGSFRMLNIASHLRFKRVTMRRLAAENPTTLTAPGVGG